MSIAQQRFSAQDRRQQILEVATELFAAKGYDGTTTREIAVKANVNEAIIFRHFPSKEDLYWEVIEVKTRSSNGRARMRELLDSGQEMRAIFVQIAERILKRRAQDQSLARLLLFSALENHSLSHRFFHTYVAEYYETLGEYILARMDEGKFRRMNPILAARGFLGMVIYHSMIQDLYGGKSVQEYDIHEVAETIVSIWLNGMLSAAPESGEELSGTSAAEGVPSRPHRAQSSRNAESSQRKHK